MTASHEDRPVDKSHPLEKIRAEAEQIFDRLSSGWHELESTISSHMPDWVPGVRKPRTDASESDDVIEFTVELPGLEPADIDVSVEDGVLTIRGEKETDSEQRDRNYYLRERSSQKYFRSFALPADAQGDKISAQCRNGLLTIRIPRSKPRKSRVHKVSIDS